MKILVLSDSHAGLSFMRYCVDAVKPDCIVHLGDYFEDGTALAEAYPHKVFYQVPGNCDRYRCPEHIPETLCCLVGGVWLYMSHGHKQNVKFGQGKLCAEARANGVQAVLYGHTHIPDCRFEDGLWILNPGSCGSWGGTVGILETDGKAIVGCKILSQADLEGMK